MMSKDVIERLKAAGMESEADYVFRLHKSGSDLRKLQKAQVGGNTFGEESRRKLKACEVFFDGVLAEQSGLL